MDRSRTTQLLQRAKRGDREALDDLYGRIGNRLLILIRVRLGPSLRGLVEAEDVVQEVLLKAFHHIEEFERDSSRSLFAWLAVIAGHTIRDMAQFWRRNKRDAQRLQEVASLDERLAATHRGAVSRILLDEQVHALEKALTGLEEGQREIILLRRFEERSFGEIATVLGLSEDACRMRFTRAMAKLTLAMKS